MNFQPYIPGMRPVEPGPLARFTPPLEEGVIAAWLPAQAQPDSAAGQDIFEAWRTLADADGLVPYLDYATPTFYDTITAQVQQLMAGRTSPDDFTGALQGDFEKFSG